MAREADARIVYCGPRGAGKTSNLKQLHQALAPDSRGKLITSMADARRAFGFEFLSVDLGEIYGLRTRLHLYALPVDAGEDGRERILDGADGVILVADSGEDRLEDDRSARQRLEDSLRRTGRSLDEVAFVLQYNKRDLDAALPVDRLQDALNPQGAPYVEAVARRGDGVVETVEEAGVRVLRRVEPSSRGDR